MPAVASSWLIGSVTIPQQDFLVDGLPASVAAGTYYLRHTNSNLSLIDLFGSEVEDVSGNGQSTTIRRSRQVHLDIAPATAVTWGTATILRDLLGYTGNLASGTSHLAPNISPLLWSPGYPGTPKTIPGVSGWPVDHKTQFKSDDGSQLHTDFYSEETWQELDWTHIVPSRLRATGTVAAQGGTFHQFYLQCARLGQRFLHHELVTEDVSDSSTDATFGTALGPYVLREFDGDYYRRRVRGADVSSPLTLPLHVVDEVS